MWISKILKILPIWVLWTIFLDLTALTILKFLNSNFLPVAKDFIILFIEILPINLRWRMYPRTYCALCALVNRLFQMSVPLLTKFRLKASKLSSTYNWKFHMPSHKKGIKDWEIITEYLFLRAKKKMSMKEIKYEPKL